MCSQSILCNPCFTPSGWLEEPVTVQSLSALRENRHRYLSPPYLPSFALVKVVTDHLNPYK